MMEKKTEINHFTDLAAWQKNHELKLLIYKITRDFPKEELFGLTSQIRRSVSSITANIAEGFGRCYFKDKNRFYLMGRGSATETQNHLITAKDLGYLSEEDYNKAKIISHEGYKLICGLINSNKNQQK